MSNLDTKTQRQSNFKDDSSIDNEVQKLFRKGNGKISSQDFLNLRTKLGNEELVDKIQKLFIEKYTEINKKAKKFAQLIRDKYSNSQYPFHILLEKAYKYKVKHGLSDSEFTEFQKIYETELAGIQSPEVLIPTTNITKLLGSVNINYQGFSSKLSDNDNKLLQEILKLHAASKPLHSQVLLQSMQYEDCGIEALTGKYNRDIHNVADHIHPVVAALFLPKISVLENHFIHSNIANIVKTRYNQEQFSSMADAMLFEAMSKDPNDVVCDSRSVIGDLYNRAELQKQLWHSVLSLRNGQYYNNSFRSFISAVDMCRLNRHDTPDLVYGRYDGTILKRLLSAFSFRPTVVSTSPVYQLFNVNPYQQNIKPTVTYVPMINLKLSPINHNNIIVKLDDALEQNQLFLENGVIVPKHTSLIYSRVLFFFVDRRTHVINLKNTMSPFNMPNLPQAAAGFERLNDCEVDFKMKIQIRNDIYNLRSVVLSEVNKKVGNGNLVVGSSTAIIHHIDMQKGIYQPQCMLYDPYSVIDNAKRIDPNSDTRYSPISLLDETPNLNNDGCSFIEIARTRGIVFMYELVNDNSNGTIGY